MNKLKNKPFLALYFAFSFVVIVIATIVSLTIGLNLGTDIGGGIAFEVKIENSTSTKQQLNAIKDVLKKHNIVAEKIYLQDKQIETSFMVKINKHEVKNEQTIRNELAEKLNIQVEDVSAFYEINGVVTKKTVIWTSVAILGLLLFVFFAGWIRYKIMAGLSLTFALLHNLLFTFAVLTLVRLPINIVSIVIALCTTLVTLVAMVLALERLRENMKLKHNSDLTINELVNISKKSTLMPLVVFASVAGLLSLIFVCVPVAFVQLSAVTLLLSTIIAGYSYYLIGMDLHENLLEIKKSRDKARLSKNVTNETSKTK